MSASIASSSSSSSFGVGVRPKNSCTRGDDADEAVLRARSLGRLHGLADVLLVRIFAYLGPRDLLWCASVSWSFNTLQLEDELWKNIALWMIDGEKVAMFCYHGSWKATALHPGRFVGLPWSQQRAFPCDSFANSVRPKWAAPRPRRDVRKWYDVARVDLMQLPMYLGRVDRRHKLSVKEFIEQYERPNRPVLITGMIDHWRAMKDWTPQRFVELFPEVPLRTNARSSNGRRYRMRAFDYFSYANTCNAEKFIYVFDKKIYLRRPDFLEYYDVPPYFREDMFEHMDFDDRPDYRWLLIGPNGSGSPFHQDPHRTSAWNAVISGCKRVSFYPPDVIPPGVDEELIHSDYYASDDMMEWYRHTLPKKVKDERMLPIEVLVNPGEILFIPSGWWHSVMNIGTTVAVTQNFCSRRTFPFVSADMNEHASRTLRSDFKLALMESPFWEYAHHIVVDRHRPPPIAPEAAFD